MVFICTKQGRGISVRSVPGGSLLTIGLSGRERRDAKSIKKAIRLLAGARQAVYARDFTLAAQFEHIAAHDWRNAMTPLTAQLMEKALSQEGALGVLFSAARPAPYIEDAILRLCGRVRHIGLSFYGGGEALGDKLLRNYGVAALDARQLSVLGTRVLIGEFQGAPPRRPIARARRIDFFSDAPDYEGERKMEYPIFRGAPQEALETEGFEPHAIQLALLEAGVLPPRSLTVETMKFIDRY